MQLLHITLDPSEAAEQVEDLTRRWKDHPGFQFLFTSLERNGSTTVTSLWVDWESATAACKLLPQHLAPNVQLRAAHEWTEPHVGEVRHIRTQVPQARLSEVTRFWHDRGRQVIESWPGCVKARGYVDREASEFVLIIWWRSSQDAEEFRLSDFHEKEFVQPLGADVHRLSRAHLDPVRSPFPRPSSW